MSGSDELKVLGTEKLDEQKERQTRNDRNKTLDEDVSRINQSKDTANIN